MGTPNIARVPPAAPSLIRSDDAMMQLASWPLTIASRHWRVDPARCYDISIPLDFNGPQPNFFGAARANGAPLVAGSFIGDVRQGGSCNCATYSLTPHCNGTHTECVGHVTGESIGIRSVNVPGFAIARLVTIAPESVTASDETTDPPPQAGDQLITHRALLAALRGTTLLGANALIVRTLPNESSKRQRSYGPEQPPPYFTANFMRALVEANIEHLICDLPSVDRAEDEGRLTAHRIFWGLAPGATTAQHATRPRATITELAYVDDAIADGLYLLNLQVAPFESDAAPSRPLLFPLIPA